MSPEYVREAALEGTLDYVVKSPPSAVEQLRNTALRVEPRIMSNDTTNEPRSLLVEPDLGLRRAWETALRGRGYSVMGTAQRDAARVLAESFHPDVIVWNCQDPAAEASIRRLRESSDAYVIATGNDLTSDQRTALLGAGADAVISLPCQPMEIAAQSTALMRRPRASIPVPAPSESRARFGPLEIDASRREVIVNGRRLSLTRIEFDVLAYLCAHPQSVVTRSDLVHSIWGPEWTGDSHMVDVHISNVRRKLDQAAPGVTVVQTVRGLGFRLSADLVGNVDA